MRRFVTHFTTRACVQSPAIPAGWGHDDSASEGSESSVHWDNIDHQTQMQLAAKMWLREADKEEEEEYLQQRARAQVSISWSDQGTGP